MSKNSVVLVTLRSSCGSVGQGMLGTGKPLTWDTQPKGGEMVHAVLSRIDSHSLNVEEIVLMTPEDWAEFETCHAEASLVHNVRSGHTLAKALEDVPAGTPRSDQTTLVRATVKVDMQVRPVDRRQVMGRLRMVDGGVLGVGEWGVVSAFTDSGTWRVLFAGCELYLTEEELLDSERFEVRECPLPSFAGDSSFALGHDSTMHLNTEDWPLMVMGSDSAEADGSTLIARIGLPSGSVGDDDRAAKAVSMGRHLIACALACRGITTMALEGLNPGRIGQSLVREASLTKERDALRESLAWITQFCAEHQDWFGKGTPADGAEFEWLHNAQSLVSSTGVE